MRALAIHARARRRAFTLVEVLVSLVLLAGLLLAVNVFLFSMTELWGGHRQQRLFEQHVRAVTHHLDDLLRQAALHPPSGRELRIALPGPAAPSGDPRLTFDLPAGDRLLPWPEKPLPDVACALALVPERGLQLDWQSRWETGYGETAPRTVVISPLVTRLSYRYYETDANAWRTEARPLAQDDKHWRLPDRLQLHFQYAGFVADSEVRVPPAVKALPVF